MKNAFGIIGGMGPMATQVLYKMVTDYTPAEKDNDHLNLMILSDASMPDRTAAILGTPEQRKACHDQLEEDTRFLENAGVVAIAVPCNTAHFFMHQIEKDMKVPLISMIRSAAEELGRSFKGQKVAILATDGTIKAGIYQPAFEANGVVPYIVSPDTQKHVVHLIFDCIKAGKPADPQSLAVIDKELKESGCAAALLACTELSVIQNDGGFPKGFYIDAMDVLARRIVEYMGKTPNVK
ncbi:MAG: amino acid racemase [Firmicutes bacterium]|nr:amino acid racemase [Bacillota bacterium]MBQ1523603.1 amino acid racemase [Bacillota bacterium]MBQ2454755.1 amino acid racemase [Bacillota bacterium]MBQ4234489.1 amino acid racemase [Bacillota bacterium]MBQ5437993.1 amino acid racemase [Bacillota bacterium]